MTDEPEAIDRPRAEVIDAYTRHLRGRLAGGIDPAIVAAALVDLLHDLGWRYIPRSGRIPDQGRKDPATAYRGADLAREGLGLPRKHTETEGDHDA